MDDCVTISYDGDNTIEVTPGRALRLAGEAYPLFRAPDPASVSDPDECLDFLRTLHLSLCPVFDIRLRRWMGCYFEAIVAQADAHVGDLTPVAGLDPANAHHAWCYAAHRPLSNARFKHDGVVHEAPILLWTTVGPLAVRFGEGGACEGIRSVALGDAELAAPTAEFLAALGGDIAEYWRDVAAPRHPFVRSALSGLRG
jgi:hypothetical protein